MSRCVRKRSIDRMWGTEDMKVTSEIGCSSQLRRGSKVEQERSTSDIMSGFLK